MMASAKVRLLKSVLVKAAVTALAVELVLVERPVLAVQRLLRMEDLPVPPELFSPPNSDRLNKQVFQCQILKP